RHTRFSRDWFRRVLFRSRGIAKVVTSIAHGNLRQRVTFEAKGEIAELADTINNMIDTLATFADQVTTVAREVGVEGKLGGQASRSEERRVGTERGGPGCA